MPNINLPHVIDAHEDHLRTVLTVFTDLPTTPGTEGFNAEALDTLSRSLAQYVDRQDGYLKVELRNAR